MPIEISRRRFLTLTAAGASAVIISELTGQTIFKTKQKHKEPEITPITETPTSTSTPVYTDPGNEPTPTAIPTPEKQIISSEMVTLKESLITENFLS